MKARISFRNKLTKSEQKAFDEECKRQQMELEKRWDEDYEAMIAYTLYKHYGFTLRKLLNFRKFFIEEYKRMCAHYMMEDAYPARHELKDLGYDVEELQKGD